jgi:diguanylate cyclase (GGDEF)-like protein/PAS domain S-box-containing protein
MAALGLTVTLISWHSLRHTEQEAAHTRFSKSVSEVVREVSDAMQQYEYLLRAGVGLFKAGDGVSRQEWHDFTKNMQLQEHYSGLEGFGYAPLISLADKSAHESEVRQQGYPSYEISPSSRREWYLPVVYLEPFAGRNLRALGFDVLSEPVRRQAVERARDSGNPVLTGKVRLLHEDENPQAGILMYLPFYDNNSLLQTVEQRRKAFKGVVYIPFRMNDLMEATLGGRIAELAFELYDGDEVNPANCLYTLRMNTLGDITSRFDEIRHLEVGGRPWTMHFVSSPVFEAAMPASRFQVVLLSGLILTALLCGLVASLSTMQIQAQHLAERMSRAYRESEARTQSIIDGAAEGIVITDHDEALTVISVNPAGERVLGLSAEQAKGQSLGRLLMIPDVEAVAKVQCGTQAMARFDIQSTSLEGKQHSLNVAITATEQDGVQRLIVLISDQTALHYAQHQTLMAGALNEAILLNVPFCIFSTDSRGQLVSINPAGERLLGYSRAELVGMRHVEVLLDAGEYSLRAEHLSETLGRTVREWESFVLLARDKPAEEHECGFIRRDGSRLPVNLAVAALRDQSGGITGYLGIAYDITARKQAEEQMRYQALHDPLTGLPNRTLMVDRMGMAIERARRNQEVLGVMLLDLDHFKQINDALGHDVGDEVLKQVALRLKHSVRQIDTVVRTEGDEFVILLGDLRRVEDASNIATKILKAIEADLIIGAHRLYLSTSVGIALYPEHGEVLDTLLKSADEAMYEVKRRGKNGCQLAKKLLT